MHKYYNFLLSAVELVCHRKMPQRNRTEVAVDTSAPQRWAFVLKFCSHLGFPGEKLPSPHLIVPEREIWKKKILTLAQKIFWNFSLPHLRMFLSFLSSPLLRQKSYLTSWTFSSPHLKHFSEYFPHRIYSYHFIFSDERNYGVYAKYWV